jgi:MFS family permease
MRLSFASSTVGGGDIKRVIVGNICFVIIVVALSWLQWANELWMLFLFTFIYGFAHGGFFAVISPLIAELFGLSSNGAIFGIIIFSGTMGGAIGPFLAGRIFDVNGGYQLAFLICAVVSVAAVILAVLLRPTTARVFSR